MARGQRRFSSRSGTRSRRRLIWARQSVTEGPFEGSTRFVDLLSLFRGTMGITANLPGVTVKRIRGTLQAAFVIDPEPINTTGLLLGVTKGNLATPGVAEGPQDLANDDWALFDFMSFASGSVGRTGPAFASSHLVSTTIDVKSQRRLDEPSETLWLALQPTDTRTGAAVNVFGWVSVLLALP